MKTTIYGIKNCSTMKKAFDWLDAQGTDYVFHDYKKAGIDPETLERWCETVGWEALVNKRGTTWRKLDPDSQSISGPDDAIALMVAHPSLIKRPVVEGEGGLLLAGFDAEAFTTCLSARAKP